MITNNEELQIVVSHAQSTVLVNYLDINKHDCVWSFDKLLFRKGGLYSVSAGVSSPDYIEHNRLYAYLNGQLKFTYEVWISFHIDVHIGDELSFMFYHRNKDGKPKQIQSRLSAERVFT